MSRLTTMCLLNIKSWYLKTGTTNPKLVITVYKSELDNNEKKKRTSTRVKHLNHDTQLMKLSQFVSFCFMTWVTNAQLSSHLIELSYKDWCLYSVLCVKQYSTRNSDSQLIFLTTFLPRDTFCLLSWKKLHGIQKNIFN